MKSVNKITARSGLNFFLALRSYVFGPENNVILQHYDGEKWPARYKRHT